MPSLMAILGAGKPPKSGDSDPDDGTVLASEILRAIKAADARMLSQALVDHHEWWDMARGEGEDEGEGEAEVEEQ